MKTMQVRNIPVADICPSELNPRKTFDQESLQELAQNIKEHGLVQPITVRKTKKGASHKYEIVCGERRFRATLLNNSEDIQCIVKELDDKQAFAAMIIENLQRKDVDPMEEAAALSKLYSDGTMNTIEMAKMLGKSTSFVVSRIQLNNIIPEFVQLMRDGTLYLVHLLDICKLTQDQQTILYEKCFSPACIARWTKKILKMEILHDMIDEHVMNFLDLAKFSTSDCSFSCGKCCDDCPLNTKNKPESFKDAKRPRCMDKMCYEQKTLEHIVRTAKESKLTLVYQGKNNDAIIAACGTAGLKLESMTNRKYVFMPVEPDRKSFNDESCYEKRMQAYRHAKAIFDSNVDDGLVEKVYEVCFDGKLSGEYKYTFSAPTDDTNAKEDISKKELISKLKDTLYKYAEQEHDEKIDEHRKSLEEAPYSTLNTSLNPLEQKIFHALLLKRLSYDFKKSIGIEWDNSETSFKANADIIEKNRNAIKREFIKTVLSEKSVCFSHDLAGMLIALEQDQFPAAFDKVEEKVSQKYEKQRTQTKAKIEELKGKKKEAPVEESPVTEEPAEASEETPVQTPTEEQTPVEEVVTETPAETEAKTEETEESPDVDTSSEDASSEEPSGDIPSAEEAEDNDVTEP